MQLVVNLTTPFLTLPSDPADENPKRLAQATLACDPAYFNWSCMVLIGVILDFGAGHAKSHLDREYPPVFFRRPPVFLASLCTCV